MGTKHDDPCLTKAADDEPLFVLRAQDNMAPDMVRLWARTARTRGVNEAKVKAAMGTADKMDAWAAEHGSISGNLLRSSPVTATGSRRILTGFPVFPDRCRESTPSSTFWSRHTNGRSVVVSIQHSIHWIVQQVAGTGASGSSAAITQSRPEAFAR